MNVHRGSCQQCGQQWVLGHVDPDVGEYGRFYCAACWDRWMETEDESEPVATQTLLTKAFEFLNIAPEEDAALEVRTWNVGGWGQQREVHIVTDHVGMNFNTCGASIWLGSKVLLKYMEQELYSRYRNGPFGVRVLELGAGCGLPGIGLGQLGADVTLTDKPDMCPLLECNAALNFQDLTPKSGPTMWTPQVMPLQWGHDAHLGAVLADARPHGGYDYIIGSEICYDSNTHKSLLDVLKYLVALRTIWLQENAFREGATNKKQTRVILALARRQGEFEAFRRAVAENLWALKVRQEVDLGYLIGDPSCSRIAVVELRPQPLRRTWGRFATAGARWQRPRNRSADGAAAR